MTDLRAFNRASPVPFLTSAEVRSCKLASFGSVDTKHRQSFHGTRKIQRVLNDRFTTRSFDMPLVASREDHVWRMQNTLSMLSVSLLIG